MTKKTFLIPWFGVLTILIALSLVVNSGPVEATEYRKQPSSIPAFNAFLSDQVDGGLANAIVGDQINYNSELSLDENGSSLEDLRYSFDPSQGLTLADGFETTPLAYDDTYQLEHDTIISVPADVGVLAESTSKDGVSKESLAADQDFDATPNVSAVAETITTVNGTVNLNADGSFTYTPTSSETTYSDSFSYTVTDNEGHTDTATVTLNVSSSGSLIIYVDNKVAGPGSGSIDDPFKSLADGFEAADTDCDIIFLFASPDPYDIENGVLQDCQKLVGQDYAPVSFADIANVQEQVPNATSDNRPTIRCSRFIDYLDGVDPSKSFPTTNQGCLQLGQNNVVAGINILNSAATQKAIAGENFGSFWGFNIGVSGSDGFSLSCNDAGFHHAILTRDIKIDGYGYFGIDMASFAAWPPSVENCRLTGHLTDVTVTNSAPGAQEAVQAYAQSDELLKLHLYRLNASNIEKTVVRMTATHNGEAELNVQNAVLSDFDSAGVYIENYVFWDQAESAGYVDATINQSTIVPNQNGRAIMATHLGRVLSDLTITNNTIGATGVNSDGVAIYANNQGPINTSIQNNTFLSPGAPNPNLPSNFTHAPQVPIYFESTIIDNEVCLDASNNDSVAGYQFVLGQIQESLGIKVGPNSEMKIANWDGSRGASGAIASLNANNPLLDGGTKFQLASGASLVNGACDPNTRISFEEFEQRSQPKRILDAAPVVNIPILPAGKTVKIFNSATVNGDAAGLDSVSNQGIITANGDTLSAKTVDPDPVTGSEASGRTVTLLEGELPTVSIGDVSVAEDVASGEATVEISLSSASSTATTVNFKTVANSATSGQDYLEQNGTIIIPAGNLSASVAVAIIDDQLTEDDEQFFVDISLPAGERAILGDARGSVTILANDQIIITPDLIVEDSVVPENTGDATVTLSLSTASTADIIIIYATNSGTATAGQDFVNMVGELLIPAGQTSNTFTVEIIDDNLAEPLESFAITYEAKVGSNVNIPDPTSTVTINDNEPTSLPEASAEDVTAIEGSGTVSITVLLEDPAAQDVGINYQTFADTAEADVDYTETTGSVIIPAGELSATFAIEILDDSINEFDEYFFVNLAAASVDSVLIKNPQLVVSIRDNDEILIGVGQIDNTPYRALEGQGSIIAELFLSRPSEQTVEVNVSTADLLAIAGEDYVSIPATPIIFEPGQVTKSIQIGIIDDTDANEPLHDFELRLANPVNAQIGRESARIVIIDNDAIFPFAFIEFPSYSVFEDEDNDPTTPTQLDIQIKLGNTSTQNITLTVGTSNITATDADYSTISSQEVVIPAGQSSATVSIDIFEDNLPEQQETFTLFISGSLGAQIDTTQSSAIVTIADGTPPVIQLTNWAMYTSSSLNANLAELDFEVNGNVVLPIRFRVDIYDEISGQTAQSRVYLFRPGTHDIRLTTPLDLSTRSGTADTDSKSLLFARLTQLNGAVDKSGNSPIPISKNIDLTTVIFMPVIRR